MSMSTPDPMCGEASQAGGRGEALWVVAECCRALAAEEVEPSPTTWQVRDCIAAGGARPAREEQEYSGPGPIRGSTSVATSHDHGR